MGSDLQEPHWLCRLLGHKWSKSEGGYRRSFTPPLCLRCGYDPNAITYIDRLEAVAIQAQQAVSLFNCMKDGRWCDPHHDEPWPCASERLRAALVQLKEVQR